MKTCKGCKYANWKRTSNGRLHPDKSGMCMKEVKMPALPASRYWISGPPTPYGGSISRDRVFENHCPYWEPALAPGASREDV